MVKFQSLFDRGGLSLDRLRSFALIAAAGGLSRAAEANPARMSLYSKQVRELEGFFGVPLTRRQGKSVTLTDAGKELARIAHAHLHGLEDFQNTCRNIPQTLSIAASNSLLEWLVLPRVGELHRALSKTRLEFQTGRTAELVRRLTDMTVDLALIREDAVASPLKSKRLLVMTYSAFLPKAFAKVAPQKDPRAGWADVPLATSAGGQFREHLEAAASKANWPLRIELSCSSFTQAARAVETGSFGAVLPSMAAVEFDPGEVTQVPLPFLKSYARPIAVAWNPRLTDVRPMVERANKALQQSLASN